MKKALALLLFIVVASASTFAQQKSETLKIPWPTEYKWKVGANQQTATQQLVEIIPQNETLKNWSIIGTMLVLNKMQVPKIESVASMMFAQTQKNAPQAKLTVIETSKQPNNKWVLFKIQSPSFKNSPKPESQLYFAIQGKSALFVNFVAIKQEFLSATFVDKWAKVFKASTLVIK
jgi:hypothetical protein